MYMVQYCLTYNVWIWYFKMTVTEITDIGVLGENNKDYMIRYGEVLLW